MRLSNIVGIDKDFFVWNASSNHYGSVQWYVYCQLVQVFVQKYPKYSSYQLSNGVTAHTDASIKAHKVDALRNKTCHNTQVVDVLDSHHYIKVSECPSYTVLSLRCALSE